VGNYYKSICFLGKLALLKMPNKANMVTQIYVKNTGICSLMILL
jgi:hypothetical protein